MCSQEGLGKPDSEQPIRMVMTRGIGPSCPKCRQILDSLKCPVCGWDGTNNADRERRAVEIAMSRASAGGISESEMQAARLEALAEETRLMLFPAELDVYPESRRPSQLDSIERKLDQLLGQQEGR